MPVTAGMIAAPIIGGAIGNMASAGDREAAARARDQALQQYLNLHVPDVAQQKVFLERYKQTGQLSPEIEQALQQQQTELGGIILDPTSRAAQLQALTKMQGLAEAGGMDAQAKLKVQEAVLGANQEAKSQRDAITQNYAQRGMGGSGVQLQAELLAGQQAANRANQMRMAAASDAEQRALQAMMNSATLGNQVRSQDYGIASDRAKAADTINAFNTRNSQAVAGANVDRRNEAQKYNVATAQDIANKNTGVANTEEAQHKGLYQQQFDNNFKVAQGASGAYNADAAGKTAAAEKTANAWAGVGQAIGTGAGAYGQKQSNDAQLAAYNKRTDAMKGLGPSGMEPNDGPQLPDDWSR